MYKKAAFTAAILFAAASLFPSGEASNIFSAFVSAFNNGDTAAVKALWSEYAWTNTYNSPQKLIKQGYGSGRQLLFTVKSVVQSNDRAAADIIVLRASDKRPSDMIFVYADKRDAWRLQTFNEDARFKALFLAGVVRSDLNPRTLPSDKDLEALGRRLAVRFPELREGMSMTELTNVLGGICTLADGAFARVHLNLFAHVRHPAVFDTRWDAALGRGALIVSGAPTADDQYPDTITLFFARTSRGYALYNTSGMLSLSGFLDWD